MSASKTLPSSPAAQLKYVKQLRAWRKKGDGRAADFWAVAARVFTDSDSCSLPTQREFLDELADAALGSDARPLAQPLTRYAARCPAELLPALVSGLGAVLRSNVQLKGLALLPVIARRKDANRAALEAIVDVLVAFLGPPRLRNDFGAMAFGHPSFRDLTESDEMRVERLGHRAVKAAHAVVTTLKARGVNVKPLEARLPAYVAPPPKTDLAALASALEAKPEHRFTLGLPSGSLSMHTSVDPDIVAERTFSSKGVLKGFSRGQATLLTMGRAVKWSAPCSYVCTALYAGDTRWLREVFSDFGSDRAQALVTGLWSDGELVSARQLSGERQQPDVLALTSAQDDAAWSFGADTKGRTVALLVHVNGRFPGWPEKQAKVRVFPR